MGHRRLGRLPKTIGWKKLLAALDSPDFDAALIAELTARETKNKLQELAENPGINYIQWLMTRIVWFSRSDNFSEDLRSIGIDVPKDALAVQFFSKVFEHVRNEVHTRTEESPFVSFAEHALRQTLTETVSARAKTLFGSNMDDVQAACREFSNQKGFGELSQRFYANLLNKYVNYFVQKELSNHIGTDKRLSSIDDASVFSDSVRHYCFQSSRIVKDFASGWYSKHTWLTKGNLKESDVKHLTSYAFTKLKMEMAREDLLP